MLMYSFRDVRHIIELFLADHFNFNYVDLDEKSIEKLKEFCGYYGTEVKNIFENED